VIDPTPTQVRAFWDYMTHTFGSQIVNKADAAEMKVLSSVLGTLGILDADSFLRHYATTIGTRIYLPFEPGVPAPGWDLWAQLVVCAHENEHVVQAKELGLVTFGARYLFSSSSRAAYEAEAYRASLELNWWRSHTMPDPAALAGLLKGYGVTQTDIDVAAATLKASADSIRRGAVINRASSVAISWLSLHAPGLRSVAA
jgi:hypothetical protein